MKNPAKRLIVTVLLVVFLTGSSSMPAFAAASPYADFSYSKIYPSWSDITKAEYNDLMKELKHPTSYLAQYYAITQYLVWISPPAPSLEVMMQEVIPQSVVMDEEECARLKEYIDKTKSANKMQKRLLESARICTTSIKASMKVAFPI